MGLRRLRGRLDQLQGEANETMGAIQALVAEIQDGVRVKVRLKITGPLVKFLGKLIWAFVTQKEPNWQAEFPKGLPCELDVQLFIDE